MAVFTLRRAGSAPEAYANNQYLSSNRQEDDKALNVVGFGVGIFFFFSNGKIPDNSSPRGVLF